MALLSVQEAGANMPEQPHATEQPRLTRKEFIKGVTSGVALGWAALALPGCSLLTPQANAADIDGLNLTPTPSSQTEPNESLISVPLLAPYVTPSVTTAAEKQANQKRVLVVVDYQVDFVSGAMGTVEPAMAIEDGICNIINDYRASDDIIIYTMDTHPLENYLFTREGSFNPPHCVPGTAGWELYGKVRDLLSPDNAIMVKKGTYGSKDLPGIIEAIKSQGIAIKSIELAGISTSCRVFNNAIILYNFFPEVEMIMDIKTTAAYSDDDTVFYLKRLEDWGFCVKW